MILKRRQNLKIQWKKMRLYAIKVFNLISLYKHILIIKIDSFNRFLFFILSLKLIFIINLTDIFLLKKLENSLNWIKLFYSWRTKIKKSATLRCAHRCVRYIFSRRKNDSKMGRYLWGVQNLRENLNETLTIIKWQKILTFDP